MATHQPTISTSASDPEKWRAQAEHKRLGRTSIALGTAARLGGTELIPHGPTAAAGAPKSRKEAFRAMDTDGSGDLDYEEFDQAMTRLGMG